MTSLSTSALVSTGAFSELAVSWRAPSVIEFCISLLLESMLAMPVLAPRQFDPELSIPLVLLEYRLPPPLILLKIVCCWLYPIAFI